MKWPEVKSTATEQLENETQQDKENQLLSIFRKFSRGNAVRIAVLAGLIAWHGQFPKYEASAEEPKGEKTEERTQQEKFDIGELSDFFEAKIVKPGDQFIIHIGSMHGLRTLERTMKADKEEGEDIYKPENIILIQKQIEKLILELKKRGIDTFYAEGSAVENFPIGRITREFDEALERLRKLPPDQFFKNIVTAGNAVAQKTEKEEHGKNFMAAHMLYIVSVNLKKEIIQLRTLWEQYKKGVIVPDIHRKFFETSDVEQFLKGMEAEQKKFRDNELIREDRIYLWGADKKLFAERVIQIRPCESLAALEKTSRAYGIDPKDPEKPRTKKSEEVDPREEYEAHNFREDVMIENMVKAWKGKLPKYIVIDLGMAHDLLNNAEKYNRENKTNLGLIIIYPRGLDPLVGATDRQSEKKEK